MSFLKQLLIDCDIPEMLVDHILEYIDDEVMLNPSALVSVSGSGQDRFDMYRLMFMKLTEIEREDDIYVCECGFLPSSCQC